MKTALLIAAPLILLAGCTARDGAPRANVPPPPTGQQSAAAPATGPSCIQTSRIRESKVIDDRTIDFVMRDGSVLRNTLPFSCPQLGFERAFSYSTSINQLCSVDIITVIVQGGGIRTGASCGLGKFVPYTPVPK
ncbi:hypothetical protein [Glacieibacterium frigidum]